MDNKCYKEFLRQQQKLQPYSNKINYPEPVFNRKCNYNIVPPGYQPKRENPGGLDFSVYNYHQTVDGVPIQFPGKGWRVYENTGKYYLWW
jgi:hypothetical protein